MVSSNGEVGELFSAGRLLEAVDAAAAAVRNAPSSPDARLLLAEMLVFVPDLRQADAILAAAGDIAPDAAIVVAEFRRLLSAAIARHELFSEGRLPTFLTSPTDSQQASLAASAALRGGDIRAAADAAVLAETLRSKVAGQRASTTFDDIRDADDILCSSLEVLSTTGKYFWIPLAQIEEITFHPPKRPRDLAWRRVTMAVRNGPDGEVYLPAIYAAARPDLDDSLRLGRATEWTPHDERLTTGVGQRMLLLGDSAVSIMELDRLTIRRVPTETGG